MVKRNYLLYAAAAVAALAAGCGSTPPASSPSGQAPVASPAQSAAAPAPAPVASGSGPRLAARDPALEQWKRQAAEKIHSANSKELFEGRPHHLLQGVIVVDVTVDKSGYVTRSKIVRSPGIPKLNNMVQASLKTASPLPAPPAALVKTGAMTYSETWLFTNDSKWRVRTLTVPQE
jgi:protein TonB